MFNKLKSKYTRTNDDIHELSLGAVGTGKATHISTPNTLPFTHIITTHPVTQLKKTTYSLEENTEYTLLHRLSEAYTMITGIQITNEYTLHILHIDEIIQWEKTKEVLGPFFTSMLTAEIGDPLKKIAAIMATGRVYKNLVIVETDDLNKINLIRNETLKFVLKSESTYIY